MSISVTIFLFVRTIEAKYWVKARVNRKDSAVVIFATYILSKCAIVSCKYIKINCANKNIENGGYTDKNSSYDNIRYQCRISLDFLKPSLVDFQFFVRSFAKAMTTSIPK